MVRKEWVNGLLPNGVQTLCSDIAGITAQELEVGVAIQTLHLFSSFC